MALSASKEIRRAVDTGKVVFGVRRVEKNLLTVKGEIVILSSNIPVITKERLVQQASLAKIPVYEYEGNALDLGAICGKPFVVSAMFVSDAGKSKIKELTRKAK